MLLSLNEEPRPINSHIIRLIGSAEIQDKMSMLLIIGSIFLGGVLLLTTTRPKKLHVKVEPMKMKVMGINIWPMIVTVNNLMPEGMRKSKVTKKVK